MEYIHTVKKYTVLLTTEEVIECDSLKVLYYEIRRVSVGVMKNSPHIFIKILTGGKLVLRDRRHSFKWERSNPFPHFFCNFFI